MFFKFNKGDSVKIVLRNGVDLNGKVVNRYRKWRILPHYYVVIGTMVLKINQKNVFLIKEDR